MNTGLSIFNEPTVEQNYLDIESASMDDLMGLSEKISLEESLPSLEGMLSDMTLAVSNKITNSLSQLKGLASSAIPFTGGNLEKITKKHTFTGMRNFPIHIPESFSGFLLEYSEALQKINIDNKADIVITLDKHIRKLSQIQNNNVLNKNLHYSKEFNDEARTLQKRRKEYGKFFKKNTGKELAMLTDVFGNWAEVVELDELLQGKKSFRPATTSELKDVDSKVQRVNELLLDLRDSVRDGDVKKRLRSLKDVAGAVFSLAEQVEFYAAMNFAYYTLLNIHKLNVKKIKEYKGAK
jgi:hypothetical protein